MSAYPGQSTRQKSHSNSRKVNGIPCPANTPDVLETDQRPTTPVSTPETTTTSPSNKNFNPSKPCSSAPTTPQQGHGNEDSKACPFALMKPGHVGDSQITWSPYGSITPRPEPLPTSPNFQEPVIEEPIAAESRHVGASSPPPSANGSISKCPIRFLDQHSPEKIVEYFEHHKHEIPRSHEVCVRRYQSNAESIRQLDSKYGNLVSMIQGLGMKHQPILAQKEDDDVFQMERNPMEKVRNWANSIKDASEEAKSNVADVRSEQDSREGLFDRPYKEIRVGESPSRPWGISVPFAERQALSTTSVNGIKGSIVVTEDVSKQAPKNLSLRAATEEDTSANAGKCFCPRPICMDAPENGFATLEQLALHILDDHKWPNQPEESSSEINGSPPVSPRPPSSSSQVQSDLPVPQAGVAAPATPAAVAAREEKRPQMLFTGPVFIGYPADQVSTILQHCGSLGGASYSSKT